ncbi:ABC transporter substrate-binding protein [Paenibacillus sp. GCM10027627]|uniref:SgrR family transcriptional regulator n=1 Tax=unclassified Paenibacillus TaxID=185978 RepID=UPI00362A5ABA
MHSEERYLMMYTKIAGEAGPGKPIDVTLDGLADVWFCTQRNVKLIVRKLEEDGLIHWQAGRGRGHHSRITFLAAKEKLLLDTAQSLAAKGEYQQAFEWIDRFGEGTSVRHQFVEWMNSHFGCRTELVNDLEADLLRLPVYRPILTLDPKDLYYAFSAHMIKQLFDCLLQSDRDTGKIGPSLAHAWEHNADGTEWTFYLRKGVFFHHGRELVAEDVVFSLERLRGCTASGWFVRTVDTVVSKGPRTVTIKLSSPNWLLPRFLCAPGLSIVPHDLVAQDEHFWLHPVGTGPFRFLEWTPDRFTMEANPHYFKGRAHLDGVVIVTMPEDTVAYSKSWEQLLVDHDLKNAPMEQHWQKVEYVCNGCSMLTWNRGKDGPQHSVDFRRAIDLLIDRSRMIRELGEDRMYPASGFYPCEESYKRAEHWDVDMALSLLAKCGYRGETIKIGTYGIHETDAQWLKNELHRYGVVVEVQVESWRSIRDKKVLKEVDCLLYCVVFAEDEVCMIECFEQTGNFLREHLDPELLTCIKERVELALACKDGADRWKELMEVERMLRDEKHVLFLLHKKLNMYYNPSIKGVGVNSLGWIDFKDIWLDKPQRAK